MTICPECFEARLVNYIIAEKIEYGFLCYCCNEWRATGYEVAYVSNE